MDWLMQDPNVQELMQEWAEKGREEGHEKATRAHLCRVLAARSIRVTPDVQARIDAERDMARLEAWLEAALTAASIADVFRDG